MVNFRERLAGKTDIKPVDPIEIYDRLDRAHDKGPLRPSQGKRRGGGTLRRDVPL